MGPSLLKGFKLSCVSLIKSQQIFRTFVFYWWVPNSYPIFYYCRFTIAVFLLVSSQLISYLRLAAVFLLMSSRLINSYPFVLILPASSLMSPNSYPGIEVLIPYVQISAICPPFSFPTTSGGGRSAHIYFIPDYLLSWTSDHFKVKTDADRRMANGFHCSLTN